MKPEAEGVCRIWVISICWTVVGQ